MASDNTGLSFYVETELAILLQFQGDDARERIVEQARRDYGRKTFEERTKIVQLYVDLAEEEFKMEEHSNLFAHQFRAAPGLLESILERPKDHPADLIDQFFGVLGSWRKVMEEHRETLRKLQEVYNIDLTYSQDHRTYVQLSIDDADTGINALANRISDTYEKYAARSSGSLIDSVAQVLRGIGLGQQPTARPPSPRTQFLQQKLDPDFFDPSEDWRGVEKFGKSMSTGVGVWLRYDQDENVIDRIVRKDLQFTAAGWHDPEEWHGDVNNLHSRIPKEFSLQQRCARASEKHFVRMRTYHQDHEKLVLSLYNEYCPHGDLWRMFCIYKTESLIRNEVIMLPEPALWFIFRCMVEQSLIMRQGAVRENDKAWTQIVHNDIKPANIFLDFPDSTGFPSYPTPKMADFGLGIETSEETPYSGKAGGTQPYLAPEQKTYRRAPGTWAVSPLLDYSNIYAIGATMFTLLCGDADVAHWAQPDFEADEQRWDLTEAAKGEYSMILKHLVMSCLEWEPRKRPKAEDLLASINACINTLPGKVGDNLRRAQAGEEIDPKYGLMYPPEEYKIGFARAATLHPENDDAMAGGQPPRADSSIDARAIPMAQQVGQRMGQQQSSEIVPLTPPGEEDSSEEDEPASKIEGGPPSADYLAAQTWLVQNSTQKSEQKSDARGLRLPQKARRTSEIEEWDPDQEDDDYKRWRGAKFLGGGIAKAALYVEVDAGHNIIDRIVVKDTPYNEQRWRWDPRAWHGWTKNGRDEDRVPIEWRTHHLASTRPEAQYIVRLRGAPCLDSKRFIYRIYIEYCSRGDLSNVIDSYYAVNTRIPQQFILFIMKALAESGLIMEQGGISLIPNDWQQIIHRDLKPDNIFLDACRKDHFPLWPQPKLADFGLAFLTSPGDPINPILRNSSAGTEGYLPPEQKCFVNDVTLQPVHDFKMLSPCNVWGVGAILMNLMTNNFNNEKNQPDYLDTGLGYIDPELRSYKFTPGERKRGRYPDELYRLVERCMLVDPSQRPTFKELLEYVENHEASDAYFRNASQGKQKFDLNLFVNPEIEKYRMGFSFWEEDQEVYSIFETEKEQTDADAMMEDIGNL